MPTDYDDKQLAKHGLTRRDADLVLRSEIWDDLGSSERGNDRLMFVGFAEDGRLLEIGVEYFDDAGREWVFHADLATVKYQKLFEQRMRS